MGPEYEWKRRFITSRYFLNLIKVIFRTKIRLHITGARSSDQWYTCQTSRYQLRLYDLSWCFRLSVSALHYPKVSNLRVRYTKLWYTIRKFKFIKISMKFSNIIYGGNIGPQLSPSLNRCLPYWHYLLKIIRNQSISYWLIKHWSLLSIVMQNNFPILVSNGNRLTDSSIKDKDRGSKRVSSRCRSYFNWLSIRVVQYLAIGKLTFQNSNVSSLGLERIRVYHIHYIFTNIFNHDGQSCHFKLFLPSNVEVTKWLNII